MTVTEYPRFRWFVMVALIIVTAAGTMQMIAAAPLVGVIAQDFHLSLGEATGMSMLTYMLAAVVSAVLGGFLIDRIGFVKIWIISLSLSIVACLLHYFFSRTPGAYVAVRFFQGFAAGPITAVISALCAQWFKFHERTYIAALQGFSIWLGLGMGVLYTPTMLQILGRWNSALAMSTLPLLVGLIFALIIHFGPKPPALPAREKTEGGPVKGDLKVALGTTAAWIIFALAVVDVWYQQAFNDLAPGFYAVAPPVGLGLGPLGAGRYLMWAGYASMLGGLVGPVVVEKVFKGRPRVPLFIVCTLSAILMLCMRLVTPDKKAALVLLPSAMLFFSSFVNPTLFGFISKHFPHYVAGRLGGIASGLAIVGAVVGLAAGATTLHITGAYLVPMTIMALVIFIGGVLVGFLRPPMVYAQEMEEQAREGLEVVIAPSRH